MNIVVCLKQVLASDSRVRIQPGGAWIDEDDARWELNEPDAYALEAALRLKEVHGGEVVAVSAGPERATRVLREALARGADRGVHATGPHLNLGDPVAVAQVLAQAVRTEAPDLVLTGLQSEDFGFAQVGVVLADTLGFPHATIVVQVDYADGRIRAKRELEGGWFQWVSMRTPAVLTIQSGINQLRYATLKGIMAAKKKNVTVLEVDPPPAPAGQRIVAMRIPKPTRTATLLEGSPAECAQALVRALRSEARIPGPKA
jgi:electron transfer flavoprotein beta subunit